MLMLNRVRHSIASVWHGTAKRIRIRGKHHLFDGIMVHMNCSFWSSKNNNAHMVASVCVCLLSRLSDIAIYHVSEHSSNVSGLKLSITLSVSLSLNINRFAIVNSLKISLNVQLNFPWLWTHLYFRDHLLDTSFVWLQRTNILTAWNYNAYDFRTIT